MGVYGTNLGQSIAGLNNAERAVRDAAPKEAQKPAGRRTRPDQPDEIVVSTETIDAVRNLKGNTQEEAHEDRREHPAYTPGGQLSSDPKSKRVDLQG